MLYIDLPPFNTLSDEVVSPVNVFTSAMEHMVLGESNRRLVVDSDQHFLNRLLCDFAQ